MLAAHARSPHHQPERATKVDRRVTETSVDEARAGTRRSYPRTYVYGLRGHENWMTGYGWGRRVRGGCECALEKKSFAR